MSITKLVLLRHGRTAWNDTRRLQGQADVELDRVGLRQAQAAAHALSTREFSAVYSSNLQRAAVTARAVADVLGLDVSMDKRLQEINVGSWSGKTRSQVEEEFPEYAAWYTEGRDFRRSASGETEADMLERATPAIDRILKRHRGEEVLVVGHGFLFSKLLQHLLGLPAGARVLGSLGNAHWSEVAFAEQATWLVAHNVDTQLRDW
ncbi:histidine phosphatase family protein [Tessaracoccus antarcticus]|uniref:histidine phosphatase family protein n=1 Tax=Tessaracoccus antarcticus TaxID=2479848 RepID=UPI001314331C|nr:histidine phosphatase family protein [Tessaracoccus antarcticus]